MALTITKLRNRIKLALGGVVSSLIDQDDIINEAGRILCQMHPWKFLERPPASIDFTADQEYASLPTDFGQEVAICYNGDSLNMFRLGTFEEVARLRAAVVLAPATYVGAIVQPTQASATTTPGNPRLELVPTPVATVTATLKCWYRAKWSEMAYSTGSEVPNIPWHLETLFCEILAAVAAGYNERDAGSMSERMAAIESGPLYRNAVAYDGQIQSNYGEIGPGAATLAGTNDPVIWSSVAAPS